MLYSFKIRTSDSLTMILTILTCPLIHQMDNNEIIQTTRPHKHRRQNPASSIDFKVKFMGSERSSGGEQNEESLISTEEGCKVLLSAVISLCMLLISRSSQLCYNLTYKTR